MSMLSRYGSIPNHDLSGLNSACLKQNAPTISSCLEKCSRVTPYTHFIDIRSQPCPQLVEWYACIVTLLSKQLSVLFRPFGADCSDHFVTPSMQILFSDQLMFFMHTVDIVVCYGCCSIVHKLSAVTFLYACIINF